MNVWWLVANVRVFCFHGQRRQIIACGINFRGRALKLAEARLIELGALQPDPETP